MQIISFDTQRAQDARLSERQEIALTCDLHDLENITSDDVLVQGFCIVFLESGRCSFTISGEDCKTEEGELIFCNYGQQISDILISTNMQFKAFFLSRSYFEDMVNRLHLSWTERSDMMQFKYFKVRIDESQQRTLCLYYELLDNMRHQKRRQQQGIEALCEAFGCELLDMLEQQNVLYDQNEICGKGFSAAQQHFEKFMQLLIADSIGIERSVSWYANQLHITPKYLNLICQQIVQQSPSSLIEKELVQRAERLLYDKTLSIKQISIQLGFSNQSQFGTYLRRSTGKSPQQIREKKS